MFGVFKHSATENGLTWLANVNTCEDVHSFIADNGIKLQPEDAIMAFELVAFTMAD